jgi:hypothetical protein
MSGAQERKERLHRLIDLALAYQSTSKSKLAVQLERDRTRLYPSTSNPRLGLIVRLAKTLEWSVDAVTEYLLGGDSGAASTPAGDTYEALSQQGMEALKRADYSQVVALAQRMYLAARTPDQRARACRGEGIGRGREGRCTEALAAYRRGLETPGVSPTQRLALQANLANAYYNLWQLTEAIAIAEMVAAQFVNAAPTTGTDCETEAFARYVQGSTWRRLLSNGPGDRHHVAECAKEYLSHARDRYLRCIDEYGTTHHEGIVHTCRGALLEAEVELAQRDPQETVDRVIAELAELGPGRPWPEGERLESFGWWCDVGANIALRHLTGPSLQRSVAILSEKLFEITRRLKDWCLIERAVSMQYALHEQATARTGMDMPYTLDTEDVRLLTGVIGRFPQSRQFAWGVINRAVMVTAVKGVGP